MTSGRRGCAYLNAESISVVPVGTDDHTDKEGKNEVARRIPPASDGWSRAGGLGFSLAERDGATIATAHSTFHPNNLLVRAMLPMIRRRFHQTHQAILRGLQDAVEDDRKAAAA